MGFVYYAERDGLIKIGYSINPRTRVGALGGTTLLAVEPGDRSLEKERHTQFGSTHETGEWFRPSSNLRDHMAALKDNPPDGGRLIRLKKDVYKRLLMLKHQLEREQGRSVSMSDAVAEAIRRAK